MNLGQLMHRAFNSKYWRNEGNYCDRKHHPTLFPYRRYKRGKNRCEYCGAKIGKVNCVRKSNKDKLLDNVFGDNPLLTTLNRK